MNAPQETGDLEGAMRAWTAALGAGAVLRDPARLTRAATATFATRQRVLGVLRPANREEVQACLRIATEHRVPVYPVSSGKNWGYGSGVPYRDAVVLDLSRLDAIVHFDEEMAYVTLQPGVTFRQLSAFLEARGSRLMLNPTGSSPDTSPIANALERGIGRGGYPDRFAHVCALEVVLPDGDAIRTGLDRFATSKVGKLYRWGVGPYVDGIFTQSNFGVVTEMTMWLAQRPSHLEVIYFSVDDEAKLAATFDALRRLLMQRVLTGGVGVWNDYKVLAAMGRHSTFGEEGKAIPKAKVAELRRAWAGGAWDGMGSIFASSAAHAEASRDVVTAALSPTVERLAYVSDSGTRVVKGHFPEEEARRLTAVLDDTMRGVPNEMALRQAYWRKKTEASPGMDLDQDRCGVVICAPVVPLVGDAIGRAIDLVERASLKHGFEPNISVICLHERAAEAVSSIFYDRDVAGEDERAAAWYAELLPALVEEGFIPYRMGINSTGILPESEAYKSFMKKLKGSLDPSNILAPGKYDI